MVFFRVDSSWQYRLDIRMQLLILKLGSGTIRAETTAPVSDLQTSPSRGGALFEGDVRLTSEQRLNDVLFGDPEGAGSRAANNVDKLKWPNAVIPYEFDCSVGKMWRLYTHW